jgi:hypothetical protein
MRVVVRGLTVAALLLAGCGGGGTSPERAAAPTRTPDAQDINRGSKARAVVYLYKVAGDDPYPWEVTVRDDATAAVVVGGGHGGGNDKAITLTAAQVARAERLAAAVPWRRIRGHTVEPGGFGGNDNMVRYMLRRDKISTTFAGGHMPASVTRLVRMLDRIIDGEIGTATATDRHYSSNGGVLTEPVD